MSKATIGFRVDLKHRETGNWFNYTSLTRLYSSLQAAASIADGLARQGETWRVVETSNRAKSADQFMRIVRSSEDK